MQWLRSPNYLNKCNEWFTMDIDLGSRVAESLLEGVAGRQLERDFESLNRLDEAGFVRLSLAVSGIFCASQKWHIIKFIHGVIESFTDDISSPCNDAAIDTCLYGVISKVQSLIL